MKLKNAFSDDLKKLIEVHALHLDANSEALRMAISAMVSHAAIGMQWQAGLRDLPCDIDVVIAMMRAGLVATEEKRRATLGATSPAGPSEVDRDLPYL